MVEIVIKTQGLANLFYDNSRKVTALQSYKAELVFSRSDSVIYNAAITFRRGPDMTYTMSKCKKAVLLIDVTSETEKVLSTATSQLGLLLATEPAPSYRASS